MNNYKNSAINLSSFLITGFIGLYIFYFLTKYINITFLGEFNFYYVVVLLLSQLGTFGIHYSILRIASDKSESKDFMNVFSGLLLISVLSFFLFSIIQMLISYFDVEYITINSEIKYASILFAMNRGLYWFLNGKEEYILMAFINPLRMLSYLILINYFFNEGNLFGQTTTIFLVGELIIFILNITLSLIVTFKKPQSFKNTYFQEHINFGKRAFLTSFFTDVSLKVDLLLIGILLGNTYLGLYTFTSALGEGFIGILTVTRTVSTPKINNLIDNKNSFILHKKTMFKISYLISIVTASGIILVSYFYGENVEFFKDIKSEAFTSLSILLIGFCLLSYGFTFEHSLLQLNFPLDHTKCQAILFFSNIILNFIFINLYQLNGAATATVISYLIYFILINRFIKKHTGEQFFSFQ